MSVTDFNFTSFGSNWNETKTTLTGTQIWSNSFSASDDGKFMCYTDQSANWKLYTSNDGGSSWTRKINYPITTWIDQYDFFMSGNGRVIINVGSDRTVISSTYGDSWITKNGTGFTRSTMGVSHGAGGGPADYISMSSSGDFIIISRIGTNKPNYSTDYGVNWQVLSNGFAGTSGNFSTGAVTVAVSRNGQFVFMGSNSYVNAKFYVWNRSTNVWTEGSSPEPNRQLTILRARISDDGRYIYLWGDNANYYYRSDNYGVSYTNMSNTISYANLVRNNRGAAISSSGKYVMIIGLDKETNNGRVFSSTNYGLTFTETTSVNFSGSTPKYALFCTKYANKFFVPDTANNFGTNIRICNNPIDMSGASYSPSLLLEVGYTDAEILSMGYSASDLKAAGYTASQLLSAGYTVPQLKVGGYTITQVKAATSISDNDLKTAGYTASNFRDTGYTVSQLKTIGYTATEMKTAGYTATEMKTAGYTANELKTAGYTATEMRTAGYTVAELKIEGYTASELKTAGYTATELKTEGYTLSELKTAGYVISELRTAGFTAIELKASGYTAEEMRTAGFTATELKAADYTATEMKTAGFTATQLKTASYTLSELTTAGYNATELKIAGYTVTEIKNEGFTLAQIKIAGYNLPEIKAAGYTLTEFKNTGFTASEIKTAGFTATEMSIDYDLNTLKTIGFVVNELKNLFTGSQLKTAGFTSTEMKTGGFTAQQLKTINYTATELKTASYSDAEVLLSGYSSTEVREAGYSVQQLSSYGYSIQSIVQSGFTALDLFNAKISASTIGTSIYTPQELRLAGYTAFELSNAGFTVSNIASAGYSVTILRQLSRTFFTPTVLKSANYTIAQLRDINVTPAFTVNEILSAKYPINDIVLSNLTTLTTIRSSGFYTDNEIISSGSFTASQLKTANYTALQLKNNFTPNELKIGGYTKTQILSGGYAVSILRTSTDPSYTILELKNGLYTPQALKDGGYSDNSILSISFDASSLKQAGYTATQLRTNNYTVQQLINATYTSTEILGAGFPSTSLYGTYSALELKNSGYTVAELIAASYPITDILSVGYSVSELRLNNFTISQLKLYYSVTEIKNGGYSDQLILQAFFTVSQLQSAGYTATDLKTNYNVMDLKNSGVYTTEEILAAKFPALSIKQAGYSVSQAKSYYTINELKLNNTYTTTEILKGGYSATQLRQNGYTALQLKQNGYSVNDLILANYTDAEILQAKYPASNLKNIYLASQLFQYGYLISELKQANYSSNEIINSGYNSTQLKQEGYTALQLKQNGFTISQIKNAGYTDDDILQLGYTVEELLTVNTYTATQLRENNYQPSELLENGFSEQSILTAGFTALQLKNENYSVSQLKNAGYTAAQLKTALFPDNDIINANFLVSQLKDASYVPLDLKGIYSDTLILQANYQAILLKQANYTASELKNAGYSIISLQNANYSDNDVLAAGYDAYDLKTTGFYNAILLKSASYTANQLREAMFFIDELIEAGYTDTEILGAGYFASQLKEANYTAIQLKNAGYSAKQLKIGGYIDNDITSIGYDSSELIVAGYTASQLQTAGYDSTQILTGLITFTENIPQAPILLNATPSNQEINVYFTVIGEASNKIFGFKYSIDDNTYLWASETTSPITIRGLTNGTSYTIKLKSVNNSGDSLPSSTSVTATPFHIPNQPTILDAVPLDKAIEITFVEGYNNGSSIIKYYYSIDSSNIIYNECIPVNNKFIISDLNNGTTYNVTMKTENNAGFSQASTIKKVQPISLPQPPTIISTISGINEITIYFTPGNNNGSEILYFKYSLDQINYFFTQQNISPIIIKNLESDTEYNISLINANAQGESLPSSIISEKTTSIPIRPIIIKTSLYDSTSILVTLLDETYNPAHTYYYSVNDDPYKEIKVIIDYSLLVTDLTPGSDYSVKVKSYDGTLYSTVSNSYIGKITAPVPIPDITNVIPNDNSALVYVQSNNVNLSNILNYQYIINDNEENIYFTKTKTSPIMIYGLTNGQPTTIKMRAVSNEGLSNYSLSSVEFIPYGKPLTPSINKIVPGNSMAYIYLNDVSNNGSAINGYEYFDGVKYVAIQGTVSPLLITNLTNKTTYNINVVSSNKAGKSELSNIISVIPGTPTPPIITNVITNDKSLTVYYTQSNNNGFTITQYQYRLNNSSISVRINGLTSPFTIPNLVNGTSYSISMSATNINGVSNDSNTISNLIPAGVPLTMSAPIITPITGDSVSSVAAVQFTPPDSNGSAITGYKYKINGSSQVFDISTTTSPVIISGLPVNINYQISMSAVNNVGISLYSPNSLSAIYKHGPPDKIIISSVIPSFQTLTVNFTEPNLNGGILEKYTYSLNGSTYIDYPNTNLPMVITGLMNNTDYNIQVKAVSNFGTSVESTLLTTPVRFIYLSPNPPRINSITGLNKTLTVNFTPSIIRGAPVTRYFYSFNGTTFIEAFGQLTSPLLITNLTNGTPYDVRLYADSDADISTSSNIVRGTPTFGLPNPPTITSVTSGNGFGIINFNAPTSTNGTVIKDYAYSLDNGLTYTQINSLTSPLTISGLTNDVSYNIRLASLSDNGISVFSQPSILTPIYSVPSAPVINTTSITNTTATIVFKLSNSNGGNISKYLYTLDNGITKINTNANISSSTGTFQMFFLTPNVTYNIRLIAENENGQSEMSSVKTVIYTVPNAPTINNITSTTKNTATIPFTLGSANGGIINRLWYSINNDIDISINTLTSPLTIKNLTSNILNTITLKAENELGISQASIVKTFTCVYTVPTAPTIRNITTTKNTANIPFTLGSANGGVISNVEYSLNDASFVQINKVTSPITIIDLSSNVLHKIVIRSINELGASTSSASKTFTCIYTVPSVPTIGTITTTKNTANIPFTLGSANGGVISNVEYSLNDASFVQINKVTSPITIIDLSSNTLNKIVISSVNELGPSISSTSKTFTCVYTVPTAPTIGNITTTKNTANIPFTLSSANGGVISNVEYSLNDASFVEINKTTSPITLTDLSSNILHKIVIRTINELGPSNSSASKTFTCVYTVPTAPKINTIRTNKTNAIVSFSTSLANGGVISNYYYSLNNDVNYIPINSLVSPFYLNDISVNQPITIKMASSNELGLSVDSTSFTFTSVYSVPDIPVILNTITDTSGVNVIFVPGATNAGITTAYYYTLDDGNTFINTGTLSNNFRIDLPNGTYNIQMKTENELGSSLLSLVKTFTIP
jgi:biotin operon repressor/ribosomal protein L13E